jgi:prepilin-type N-terminal cleavage/methylation domain-containing protein
MKHNHQNASRKGFTLIELLVVIVIIAALAALIVPNVGMFGRSTDMAVSAKSQSDLANNVQQFFVLQKRYPQGLDSLLDTTGVVYASDTTSGDTQTRGLPYSGADGTRVQDQLTAVTLTNATGAEYLRSVTRAGFDWVYDHDTAVVNSNVSNTTARGLAAIDATASPTGVALTADPDVAEVTGTYLRGKLVPGGLKTGQRIVDQHHHPALPRCGQDLLRPLHSLLHDLCIRRAGLNSRCERLLWPYPGLHRTAVQRIAARRGTPGLIRPSFDCQEFIQTPGASPAPGVFRSRSLALLSTGSGRNNGNAVAKKTIDDHFTEIAKPHRAAARLARLWREFQRPR